MEYFGANEFAAMKSKLIMNAYERNGVSIVKKDSVWWFEHCKSNRVHDVICNRMKKCYPELTFLYDLH